MTKETVQIASDDARKDFMDKLKSKDFYAVEHTLTFKAVEFIPFKKFNEKHIKAEEFKTERDKYIKEHSTDLHDALMNFKSILSEQGLYVQMCGQGVSNFNPIDSMLEQFSKLSPEKLLETLKSFADSTTPPIRRAVTLPKQASKSLACL